jgi:hypothetical protein
MVKRAGHVQMRVWKNLWWALLLLDLFDRFGATTFEIIRSLQMELMTVMACTSVLVMTITSNVQYSKSYQQIEVNNLSNLYLLDLYSNWIPH